MYSEPFADMSNGTFPWHAGVTAALWDFNVRLRPLSLVSNDYCILRMCNEVIFVTIIIPY